MVTQQVIQVKLLHLIVEQKTNEHSIHYLLFTTTHVVKAEITSLIVLIVRLIAIRSLLTDVVTNYTSTNFLVLVVISRFMVVKTSTSHLTKTLFIVQLIQHLNSSETFMLISTKRARINLSSSLLTMILMKHFLMQLLQQELTKSLASTILMY